LRKPAQSLREAGSTNPHLIAQSQIAFEKEFWKESMSSTVP
jgi:hypothetical protein